MPRIGEPASISFLRQLHAFSRLLSVRKLFAAECGRVKTITKTLADTTV